MDDSIDRETLTLSFQRTLQASLEEVFDAWTQPEQIAAWWDPTGTRLAACRIDLRQGGTFHFENVGHSPPFTGVYKLIERPSKLVFEALGTLGTVSLTPDGSATRMQVTIRSTSKEQFEAFLHMGVGENTTRTLNNLGTYLQSRIKQSR
jgi:uncharacterized protein YndB with AHSA1/START domain